MAAVVEDHLGDIASRIVAAAAPVYRAPPTASTGSVSRVFLRCSFCAIVSSSAR
jgi:hypothetical protein